MTLRKRLFAYFIAVSVIPVLLVGSISYYLAFRNVSDNALSASLSVAERVSSDVEKMLDSCFNLANSMEDSISYQEAMRRQFMSEEDRYSTELRMSLNMYVEVKYTPEIFGLYILGENEGAYKSSFNTLLKTTFGDEGIYKAAFEHDDMTYLESYEGSRIVSSLDYSLLAFGRAYADKATGEKNGVILLEIQAEKLEELLSFDIGPSSYIAVTDTEDNILASVGNESAYSEFINRGRGHEVELSAAKKGTLFSYSPIVIKAPVSNTELSVVMIISESDIIKDSKYISIVISLLCAAVILTALAVSWNMAKRVTQPINKLVGIMHKVEAGDLTVSIAPKYNDEISILFRSFNIMIEKINTLMLSIQDEQQKLRASEMRALMNQINPHFLYNTLDSIVWLCRAGMTDKAAVMTDALASFFRIGLSKGRDIVTVQEELMHVMNYLKIQEIRGGDTFDYDIDTDKSLYKYNTVKFIWQPLVENAIYHAVYKMKKRGHISLTLYEEDGNIVMGVADTGPGLTPEHSRALEETLKAGVTGGESMGSYGLVNVNSRIKAMFGEQYGIRFFSVYGKGSTFEIVIPIYEEGNRDV